MSIVLKKIKHLIDEQYNAEQKMLTECAASNHTLDAPYVKCNPYGIAPLTALVYFTTPEATEATVRVMGKEKAGDISHTFSKTQAHFLPILGLYPDAVNRVEITLGNGAKKHLTIRTEKAPKKVFKPTKIETTAEYMNGNVVFLSPTSPANLAAYDYLGDVRWYSTINFSFDLKRAKNGHLLLGTHRLFMPPYHTTGIFEMDMIGKIYKEFRLPGGYHHDQLEMEDGNLLILTQDPTRGTVEDMCVLVDRTSGAILKTWDFQSYLPQNVGGSGSQDKHDWFHNNSVWYDKNTHSLTFSGRHQDIIINVGFDSGQLNWVIGDPEGWPEDLVKKYFFTPAGDLLNFDWQYEQHSAFITPGGDVMCFDNGHWRSKNKENYLEAKDNFSRGVRWQIDTDRMEIQQVWQYGKERGAEFFSTYICNVEYYGEGHYMIHSGGIGTFKGETCNQPPTKIRGADEQFVALNSITVEIDNGKVMYEMHVPANYYRAEKLPLYSAQDTLSFGKGELLGALGVTEEFGSVPDMEHGGMAPKKHRIRFGLEVDRLIMKGSFEKGQMVMLILEGSNNHAYFIPTTRRAFLAMCVGTLLEEDDRAVEFPISFENLSGEFNISLIIDDRRYDTGVTLTV